jgi:predicted alpha/beta-hydrolase family hydrolase
MRSEPPWCASYPFHPPVNPGRMRVKHLENLRTPALIIQGSRDSFGRPDEVGDYHLSEKVRIVWIEAGDHSLKPPARSGRTEIQNLASAISEVQRLGGSMRSPWAPPARLRQAGLS